MEQVVVVDTTLFGGQVQAVPPHLPERLWRRLQTVVEVEPTLLDSRLTLDT
jgi:hypothetical protein